jgi:DNA polymerase
MSEAAIGNPSAAARDCRGCDLWQRGTQTSLEKDHEVCELCWGRSSVFRVTRQRGQLLPFSAASQVMATVHPSSMLRAPDDASRRQEFRLSVRDLALVSTTLYQSENA